MTKYDVVFKDSNNKMTVHMVIANRSAEEVERWYKDHQGATNITVKETDNSNATGQMIVRL